MADITIFEFDLTDAQFYAPFAGGGDATDDTATTTTGAVDTADDSDGRSLLPLGILVGLVIVAYLIRRWRTDGQTDIEVTGVEVEPDSETESA